RLKEIDERFTELTKLACYFLAVSEKGAAGDFLENGRQLFVAAGLYAIERGDPTIGEILRIITRGSNKKKAYTNIAEVTRLAVVRRIFTDFASMNDRTLTSTISVLNSAGLNLWNNPKIDRVTRQNDFSFSDLRKSPQSIYIVANSDDIKPLAPLIRLLFGELVATLRSSLPDPETEPWPVMIMLDEFDQLGAMPVLVQSLKQLAGHGARVSIITQSIPGLDKIYDENDRLTIESSAGMKLYLSANDRKTAGEVSENLGKTTRMSVSDSLSKDNLLLSRRSVSRRNEERPLLSADEVRRLSPDQVILVPERQNPVLAKRIVYYQDPKFMRIVAAQVGDLPYPKKDLVPEVVMVAENEKPRENDG
ncbi:MAG: type IV secretory system conjugative DNA transfer family protein, partial [Halocynthiibacter sp.]